MKPQRTSFILSKQFLRKHAETCGKCVFCDYNGDNFLMKILRRKTIPSTVKFR